MTTTKRSLKNWGQKVIIPNNDSSEREFEHVRHVTLEHDGFQLPTTGIEYPPPIQFTNSIGLDLAEVGRSFADFIYDHCPGGFVDALERRLAGRQIQKYSDLH